MPDTLPATTSEPPTATATYTVAEIAILTQSSERHVHRLNDLGRIPGRIKGLGRLVRFSRAAVDAWLTGKTEGRG
jgi:excisionase family DNA binding protein